MLFSLDGVRLSLKHLDGIMAAYFYNLLLEIQVFLEDFFRRMVRRFIKHLFLASNNWKKARQKYLMGNTIFRRTDFMTDVRKLKSDYNSLYTMPCHAMPYHTIPYHTILV